MQQPVLQRAQKRGKEHGNEEKPCSSSLCRWGPSADVREQQDVSHPGIAVYAPVSAHPPDSLLS